MKKVYAISDKKNPNQIVKSLVLIDDKYIESVKQNFDLEPFDQNPNTNDPNTNDSNTNDPNTNDPNTNDPNTND